MAIFVGGTVVIYIILTCVSVQTEHVDQRAWMGVARKGDPLPLAQNIAPSASIVITNTGKTLANRFSGNYYLEVVKNGERPHFEAQIQHVKSMEGIVLPSGVIDVTVRRLRHKDGGGPDEAEDDPLTSEEIASLSAGHAWIAVHGFIRYSDVFHDKHWTRFCFWIDAAPGKYPAESCVRYNSTDDYPSEEHPTLD